MGLSRHEASRSWGPPGWVRNVRTQIDNPCRNRVRRRLRSSPRSAGLHQEGIALLAVLGLTVLILGLAGATFGLFSLRAKRAHANADLALTRQLADDTLELSTEGLSALVALAPTQAAMASFYYLGGDLDGDHILSKRGEIREVDPGVFRYELVDQQGNPVSTRDPNNPAITYPAYDEDVGLDNTPDELELFYDPIRRPDPARDNYHPLFNPNGTEGNGVRDREDVGGTIVEEADVNRNNQLDLEEDASLRWLRTPGRVKGFNQSELDVSDGTWAVRGSDVNNCVDLNGPEVLTARLLNNLFRMLDLREGRSGPIPVDDPNTYPEVLGENGRGFESADNMDILLRTGSLRLRDFFDNPIPIEPTDPDAVKIIKARRNLPGGVFSSAEQLLEVAGPQNLGILNIPALQGHADALAADPNDPNSVGHPTIDVVSDLDEYRRIKPFLTCHSQRRLAYRRKQDQPGQTAQELRAHLPINTAPSELIASAVLTAFDPQIFPIGGGGIQPRDVKAAARYFARVVVNFRMGRRIFKPRASGLDRSVPGIFRSFEDFQEFMVDLRAFLRNDTSYPNRNDVLLSNFDNIVIQFSENQVYQSHVPDRVQDAPVDKTSLRLSLPSQNVTFFPTGVFQVEAESRIRLRDRKLDDRLFADSRVVFVGGAAGGRRPRDFVTDLSHDKIARTYSAVVKVADVLHHTSQEDFEGQDGRQAHHVNTRTYPEVLPSEDLKFRPALRHRWTINGNLTAAAFDRERGIVYFLNSLDPVLYALHYGRFDPQYPPDSPSRSSLPDELKPEPFPIAAKTGFFPSRPDLPEMPTDYVPGDSNFLEIDTRSEFGDQGRLYLGRRGLNRIDIFDLVATVPEGAPVRAIRRPAIDLETAPVTDHPNYDTRVTRASVVGLVPYPEGRGFFLVADRRRSAIVRFVYPRVDNRAKPEEDDPFTPIDERTDNVDNDRDGVVDDRPGTGAGTPEGNLFDLVDNDGDGMVDDGAERGLTAALPLLPPAGDNLGSAPVAWAYDPVLDHFVIANENTIERVRSLGLDIGGSGSGMVADAAHRKRITSRLDPSERVIDLAIDPGVAVYVLTLTTTTNRSRVLRFSAQRLAFEDVVLIPDTLNIEPAQRIAYDPTNRMVLVAGRNRLLFIRDRGSLLDILRPIGNVGNRLEIVPDAERNWLLTTSRQPGHISLYDYNSWPIKNVLVEPGGSVPAYYAAQKHFDKGGQVKAATLSSQDTPQGPKQFLLKGDFDQDMHLRRPSATKADFQQATDMGSSRAAENVQGQVIRYVNRNIREPIKTLSESVFAVGQPRLTPDGVFVQSNTLHPTHKVIEALRYDPIDIYGSGGITGIQPNRGLRVGGVGFWLKLDGLGLNELGQHSVDPNDVPSTIDLFRMFHKVKISPWVFIRKDPNLTDERELELVLNAPENTILGGSIKFFPPDLVDYRVETRISLRQLRDSNGNGDIDTFRIRCGNHMDLASGNISVSYQLKGTGIVSEDGTIIIPPVVVQRPYDPVIQNLDLSYRPSQANNRVGFREAPPRRVQLADGGEWIHILNLWGQTLEAGPEKVHARFYVNGKRLPHDGFNLPFDPAAYPEVNARNGIDDDRDGMADEVLGDPHASPEPPGTRRNLIDDDGDGTVDDGYTVSPPFCSIGIVLDERRPPEVNMRGIVDDLVFYPNQEAFRESATSVKSLIELRRFNSRGETLDTDPDGFANEGEPFNDLNGNGRYDGAVRSYYDRNGNGVHDRGEPYEGMYPFDFGNSIPGEPYYDYDRTGKFDGTDLDQGDSRDFDDADLEGAAMEGSRPDPTADYYEDTNGNQRYDGGEFYSDLRDDTSWTPPEAFRDQNFNGTLDGAGKFVRNFDQTLAPGDRVAWMAFDGITPEGTALVPELVLTTLGGRKVNHFFGDRESQRARVVGFQVKEPSRLQYRINFMISRDQGIYEPFRAGDGIARSTASGDDIQLIPVNGPVRNGRRIIGPGPNGFIDSIPAGGDRFVLPFQSPVLESVTVAVVTSPKVLELKEIPSRRRTPKINVKRMP